MVSRPTPSEPGAAPAAEPGAAAAGEPVAAATRRNGHEARDPALRRLAERAQLKAALGTSIDGLLVLDASGNVVLVNDAESQIFGGPELELRDFAELFALSSTDGKPLPLDQWPAARALRGEHVGPVELRVSRRDTGHEWIVEVRAEPVRDDDGRPALAVVATRDVTLARRRELALRESEERLRLATEIAGIGTYDYDARTGRAVWSERLAEVVGLESSAPPAIADDVLATVVHPEDRERLWSALRSARDPAGSGRHSVDLRIMRPDGEIRWIREVGRVFFEEVDGRCRPVRTVGTVLDITERMQVEEALRAAAERDRFRTMLTDALRSLASPEDIETEAARALGRHLRASRVHYAAISDDGVWCHTRTGYTDRVASFTGAHHLDSHGPTVMREIRAGRTLVVSDVDTDQRLTDAEKAATARVSVGAYVLVPRYKQGRAVGLFAVHQSQARHWTRDEVALMEEVAERTWAAVERASAENALRASEERYRTLIESIDQGFCVIEMIFDAQGVPCDYRFLETNPAFERHTGLVGAVGRRVRELVPELETSWFETYGRVATTGASHTFVLRSEAMKRWFEVTASRVGAPEERKVALLFTDITERKRAEEELRESDRRKDEYLAMLGHELRNPLAAIQSATELVKLSAADVPALRRVSAVLERQSSHMAGLIEGLLEVSRIARGKIALDLQTVDLRDVVAGVLEDRRVQIGSRGLELDKDLPPSPLWVTGDRVRLAQVFDNLLTNALKFTTPPGRVHVSLGAENGCAVLRVRDTGVGIRPDRLARVFEPFYQEEQDAARGTGGLGLGLALARGLVELHEGSIEARSEGRGAGTEMLVRVPLTLSPPPAWHGGPVPHATPRRILVVEDNADAAEMMRVLLEVEGHTVSLAGDGIEAIRTLERAPERFDVVVCDLGLPGMSGYDVARRIRTSAALRELPLVALTGYGQPEDRRRTEEAGFDAHLTKPVSLGTLRAVLDRVTLEHPHAVLQP